MFRRILLAAAALAVAAGMTGAGAAAASAGTPVNHCPLWANYHLHGPYPHCYANL